jgi:hypothetical protein
VTVTHAFKSADKAEAFASSPDLKTAMEKAGVKASRQCLDIAFCTDKGAI